eukprot:Gregarina_sp_Poly_1__4913@NODE_2605_length_1929_cov_44_106874_g1650_i0_p4_GENE_NODE_2605_length_1929_cov_44_106874_g1650_i0NODE_2605_length_1929_cov_44_106874_g1650_i0_p4_ORF_typecomplete_len123_score4_19Ribonuclease_3/PF00636_26/0_1_NODE_2605_length_1929_cov_44_106874_g1650_i06721040
MKIPTLFVCVIFEETNLFSRWVNQDSTSNGFLCVRIGICRSFERSKFSSDDQDWRRDVLELVLRSERGKVGPAVVARCWEAVLGYVSLTGVEEDSGRSWKEGFDMVHLCTLCMLFLMHIHTS